jgi:GT2 family glycosyltransferase
MPLPNALRGIWRTRSFGGEAGHPFMITIVCGTRHSAHDFAETTPLGASLKRLAFDKRINTRIAFGGNPGLPVVYNKALEAPDVAEILVFIHDDVWIDDYFFSDRIEAALQSFDIIGVAGNRRRVARQPSWAHGAPGQDNVFTKDRENHSGAVAHGKTAFGPVDYFGPTPAACELLDGVLLAAKRDALRSAGVGFDEQFDFHFYDMDFCRSAKAAGLSLGCWAIAITHGSVGPGLGKPDWRRNYRKYLKKWGE